MEITPFGAFSTGLRNKVSILFVSVSLFFNLGDICYYGRKSDLKKLLVMENTVLRNDRTRPTDVAFYSQYFVQRYPIIEEFVRLVNELDFNNCMMNLKITDQEFELPSILNKLYALYFVILYTSFAIQREREFDYSKEISLEDIFYFSPGIGIQKNWNIEFRNSEILRRIVSGELKQSVGYKKLYDEICRMKEAGYAENMHFTRNDYEEFLTWLKLYSKVEEFEWIKPYTEDVFLEKKMEVQLSFEESVDVLFSEYNLTSDLKKQIWDIAYCNNASSGYYDTIISHLDDFREKDYELYKKALFTSTRFRNGKALLRTAEEIVSGRLKEYELVQAMMVYKRYPEINLEDNDSIEAWLLYAQFEDARKDKLFTGIKVDMDEFGNDIYKTMTEICDANVRMEKGMLPREGFVEYDGFRQLKEDIEKII